MFFSVLHVCIIEIDFGFFLLDLNLMVKALHHEVTCKNALLKAKCSEQEVKRTLWQFTPVRWDKDEWHPLQATWHVIQVLTICIIFLTVALNTLFLKFSMWIPSTNPLILYSLILWLLIARAKALESDYVFDESSGYYYSSRLSRWQRL
uniref:CDP-diacylglycerol--serine O-phosphatidyltransferase n=1 Tax=Brassica oleracea var. oleracea TaxID=109376 RepID=A0A0D3DVN2_BRAOL